MILYSRQYSSQGEPLLILHGLFGNQGNWAWHARELSTNYAVTALDLRNHGRSGWADEHDYAAMARDVAETMDSLGLESAHLMGHSMGGKVAMQLALSEPARVRSLVVVDIAPVTYADGPYGPLDAMQELTPEDVNSRAEADEQMARYIGNDGIRDFLLTNLHRGEDGQFHWRCNLKAIAANFPAIRAAPLAEGPYTGPTLFVKGGQSEYVLAEHRDEIEARFPAVSLKVIDQAGHWLHSEKPRAFLKIVRDFLVTADGSAVKSGTSESPSDPL